MKTFVLMTVAVMAAAGSAMAVEPVAINADFSKGIQTDLGDISAIRAQLNASYGDRAITAGDTYGAALLGQSTAGAAFITNTAGRVTTFTYDQVATVHGTLAGSNAVVGMGEAQVQLSPNTLRVIVQCFTADSTDLWISGLTIGGVAMSQGRLDVGSNAIGSNGLLWDNLPGAVTSVSIFNALFVDGTNVASSSALTNLRTLPQVGSAVVWNGVVASGVDESWMVFDITYIPTPGSMALVGMGGLLAARRRR